MNIFEENPLGMTWDQWIIMTFTKSLATVTADTHVVHK